MEQLSVTATNRRSLWIVFGLTFIYFLVEVVGGLLTHSLALLADAAHMLTDVGGLGLALFAAWMSTKPATPQKTYGYYRIEILAALANAVVLFLMAFFILFEAYRRFREPPEVSSLPMMGVAAVGLVVNLIGMWMLSWLAGLGFSTQLAEHVAAPGPATAPRGTARRRRRCPAPPLSSSD